MKRFSLLIFMFIFVLGTLLFHQHASLILSSIEKMGVLAPVLFVILYICMTVFFLPTLMLTFAGGALFGPLTGTFFNLLGATAGAMIAFCISRYWLVKHLHASRENAFSRVIEGIDRHGWYFLALVRLLPIIPFNLVNYGMGFTHMSLKSYGIITVLFLAPTEIFYTWCGFAGRKILTIADFWSNGVSLIIGSVLVGVVLVYKWRKRIYRTLKPTR